MMRWQAFGIMAVMLTLAARAQAEPPAAAFRLWYDKPANDWMTEALPIGNGRVGAMVFGGVGREHLQFNEDSLWIGDEKDTGAYQAFGDVYIDLAQGGRPAIAAVECASGHDSPGGQAVDKTIDGAADTKWCLEHHNKPVVWLGHFGQPLVVSTYAFTSAEDMPNRDPRTWTLEGSADGKTWVLLDKRADEPPHPQRRQRQEYAFDNQQEFTHYRFTFSQFRSATHFQLAEIELGRKGGAWYNRGDVAATEYRRELNISKAIHTVTYARAGIHYRREYFASHPANVMVFHFTADKPGAYTGAVTLTDMHKGRIAVQGQRLISTGSVAGYRYKSNRDYAINMQYEAQVLLLNEGGTIEAAADRITFANANSLTIFINAGTDYLAERAKGWRGENPHQRLTQQLDAAAAQPIDALRSAHLADYQPMFDRLRLNLGVTPPGQRDEPTGARLISYAHGQPDPELEALLFQFGRYLMIGSSRDALPANLQGLWNNSNNPPWRSDYHSDVNLQMNYWLIDQANVSDCFRPLFDWVRAGRAVRTEQTQEAFHARGWALRGENGIFGGSSWNWVPGGSAWICQNLWDHYAFTQDQAYLKELYPILKEICEFWEDHLKALPDGTLVSPNDFSPEHGPTEDGVTFDQMLVWDLFTNYLQAARTLDVDADYRAKVSAMREKLLKPRIGKWGQLQEWMIDRDDPADHHRHTSHMIGLHPGRQISPRTTPALAAAAKVSLTHRGDESTGWAMVWRISLWARLLEAEHAYKMLHGFIHGATDKSISYTGGGGLYSNLLDACPPFQIDGNFGYCAGVSEMLLQSQNMDGANYVIDLLPALPKAWPTGSVRGLRARGGFFVDMDWNGGKLTQAIIHSVSGTSARVRYGEKVRDIQISRGQAMTFAPEP